MRKIPRLAIVRSLSMALGALWLLPTTGAAAAPTSAPTSYRVRPLCAAPTPGHAACLGLRLERGGGSTTAAPAATPAVVPKPISPTDMLSAYGLPTEAAEPQTVAIVDAYDDPHAEEDLATYDQHFGLPPCTHLNGCFTKILGTPTPPPSDEWSTEIATDIEVVHALCKNCSIVLVEASSASYADLEAAEEMAVAAIKAASKPGTLEGEISNSWGGPEPLTEGPAFDHPGIVITASAGDAGYLNWDEYTPPVEGEEEEESGYFDGPDYPASLPHVVAVGGTSLTVGTQGEWVSEEVWNDAGGAGGGGCSAKFSASPWQQLTAGWPAVGCGTRRAVADIAADADPYTGVRVYDSLPAKPGGTPQGWMTIGGTSVASPIIAAAFALAGGAHGVAYPAATLYAHAGTTAFHDITVGGNGECDGTYSTGCSGSLASPLDCGALATICNAAGGYDGPTGVGTPTGLTAFQPVAGEVGGPGEGSGAGTGGGGSSGGGGNEGGGGGTGGQEGPAHPGGGSSAGAAPTPPAAGTSTPGPASGARSRHVAARVSRLSLIPGAVSALNRARPSIAEVAFRFVLNTAARVRVTLARRVEVRGHWRWIGQPGSLTIAAAAGANRAHLHGHGELVRGLYRLTLKPATGSTRSLLLAIG